MKRLLPILFLLCLAADGEDGWTTTLGQWKRSKTRWSCDEGTIEKPVTNSRVTIRFYLTIRGWNAAAPRQLAAVFWWSSDPNQRYQLVFRQNQIDIERLGESPIWKQNFQWPTNKRVPVELRLDGKSVSGNVGPHKLPVAITQDEAFSKIALHAHGAKAEFSSVSVD